jgi:ferredoxin
MVKSKDVNKRRVNIDADFSANLKEITKYYGATSVGIVKLTDYSYYSHFGGLNDELGIYNYNEKITPHYTTAIVFTVKMNLDFMNRAPNFEELLTTEDGYIKAASVGARLALYIKELGYSAMFNNSEYYLAPLVPLAHDAGLGQIGMCNHIVTKEHGNNVRLGAVFTTLEVNTDKPVDYGLIEFCNKCALCLSNCPSKAITHKPRIVNGRQFYKFDENRCFDMWVKSGTDCGTCIQSCPFTQGVDFSKLERIKEDPKVIDELMKEHYEKFGRRKYTKNDLDIVKIGDNDGNND